jgi:hypothetical protein
MNKKVLHIFALKEFPDSEIDELERLMQELNKGRRDEDGHEYFFVGRKPSGEYIFQRFVPLPGTIKANMLKHAVELLDETIVWVTKQGAQS